MKQTQHINIHIPAKTNKSVFLKLERIKSDTATRTYRFGKKKKKKENLIIKTNP